MRPAWFRRGRDRAVGRRARVKIDGPERPNTDRCQWPQVLMVLKECDGTRKCLSGRGGGETRLSPQIVRAVADRAYPLGAAGFDAAIHAVALRCPCHHPNSLLQVAGSPGNPSYAVLLLIAVRSG